MDRLARRRVAAIEHLAKVEGQLVDEAVAIAVDEDGIRLAMEEHGHAVRPAFIGRGNRRVDVGLVHMGESGAGRDRHAVTVALIADRARDEIDGARKMPRQHLPSHSKPPVASTTPRRAVIRRRPPAPSTTAPVTRPAASVISSTARALSSIVQPWSRQPARSPAISAVPWPRRPLSQRHSSFGASRTLTGDRAVVEVGADHLVIREDMRLGRRPELAAISTDDAQWERSR